MIILPTFHCQLFPMRNYHAFIAKRKRWRYATGRRWREYEDEIIRRLYPRTKTSTLARRLERPESSVYQRAHGLGLKKDPEWLSEHLSMLGRRLARHPSSLSSRYQKGMTPVNKGKKWQEYMSPAGMRASSKTQFKEGNLPHTTRYDGCISIRTDRDSINERKYKWIRIAQAKWMMYHVFIWTEKHGPVPPGCIIVFRDGNSMNCSLSNLQLLTREELMQRNTLHQYPRELKEVIVLNNKLKKAVHEKRNQRSA